MLIKVRVKVDALTRPFFIATARDGWRRYRGTGYTEVEAVHVLESRIARGRANRLLKQGYPRELEVD